MTAMYSPQQNTSQWEILQQLPPLKLVIGSAGSGSQIPGSRIRNPDPDPWIRPLDLNVF